MFRLVLTFAIFIAGFVETDAQKVKSKQFLELEIGKGGGFAAAVSGFILENNGNLYRCYGSKTCTKDTLIRKLNKSELRKLDKILSTTKLLKYNIQEPGNVYNYIKITTIDTTHLIIWNPFSNSKTAKDLNKVFEKIEVFFKQIGRSK